MKAIIYNTEEDAKNADWSSNTLTGSATRYRYARKLLTETTTLTKAEYAALYNIPATLTDDEGVTTPNSTYQALEDSYTLNKCGLVVGDEYDITAEDGTTTVPAYVVDISSMLLVAGGE